MRVRHKKAVAASWAIAPFCSTLKSVTEEDDNSCVLVFLARTMVVIRARAAVGCFRPRDSWGWRLRRTRRLLSGPPYDLSP
eukprot:23307-Eustigmatos_ZCMA.PRE.1